MTSRFKAFHRFLLRATAIVNQRPLDPMAVSRILAQAALRLGIDVRR